MKNNGFTIIELVIVIAVVAVLAAVLIPTFAGIVKRANISSDIQTARNMGTILAAEKPTEPSEAVDALKANGFEKLHPKTNFYRFYWIKSLNIVVLTAEGVRPIFPEEMANAIFDPNDWFDLTREYIKTESEKAEPPITPEPPAQTPEVEEETDPPEPLTVTYTYNKPDWLENPIRTHTIEYGSTLNTNFKLKTDGNYWITNVTVYVGGKQHDVIYGQPGKDVHISYNSLTADVAINIHVVRYCNVIFKGEGIKSSGYTNPGIQVERGVGFLMEADKLQKYFIPEGYEIESVTAIMGGNEVANVYDPEKQILWLHSITGDTTVTIVFREKQSN